MVYNPLGGAPEFCHLSGSLAPVRQILAQLPLYELVIKLKVFQHLRVFLIFHSSSIADDNPAIDIQNAYS